MGFIIVTDDTTKELNSHELIFRYDFSGEYPKIEETTRKVYRVWISRSDRLETDYEDYLDAEAMCEYLKGLEYNIRGLWNAGG